ncbi:hypothetical protein FisN_30Hh013 [Fistulifera solaris]|uniref:Uncharacterized protein n=1 Tax=Fistulifera solaris TaxID=1519565 RepID=A0A1Z5K6F5_FISSO|nr:hypothetical protein FisN_30Hh013 [Fistulifera solaris]|eukprot:GAX21814.1 hypothetical protein FisN_30Hh013 [Fistulifera solaris]
MRSCEPANPKTAHLPPSQNPTTHREKQTTATFYQARWQMIEGNNHEPTSPVNDLYKIFKRRRRLSSASQKQEDDDEQSITSATASAISGCELERSSIRTYLLNNFSRKQLSVHILSTPFVEGFQALLEKEYTLALQDNKCLSADGPTIDAQLAAARNILCQLRSSFSETKQTGSQIQIPTQSRRVLFQLAEYFFRQRARLTLKDASSDEVANKITLINELLKLINEVFPKYNVSDAWQSDLNELVEIDLEKGVRKRMRAFRQAEMGSLFTREIHQKQTGRVRTSFPVCVIRIVDDQLVEAKRCLSSDYIQVVLSACNEEMSQIVAGMLQAVEQACESLNAKQLCAFINDVDRLRELMEKRYTKYVTRPSLKKLAEKLEKDIIYLSQHTSALLARRLMRELVKSEKISSNIGNARWETDLSRTGAVRIVSALKVQFKRFDSYLGDEFPRFLKACFDQMMQLYVEALLRNTLRRRCVARNVSQGLEADYAVLLSFFNGDLLDKHYGRKGFYNLPTLNLHLHLLKSIANIIKTEHSADDLKHDIRALLRALEPTENATRLIMHFAALDQRYEDFDSATWLKVIVEARIENTIDCNSSFCFGTRLDIPFLEKPVEPLTRRTTNSRQERPVVKCIRNLKKPPVVLRAQSDTVSVV